MRLVPWLACAFLTVTTIMFGTAYVAAERNAADVKAQLAARDRLEEQTAARFLPIPSARTVQFYGPPYNVTITCEVAGSGEGDNGARTALDMDRAPLPGDVYRKTCRAAA